MILCKVFLHMKYCQGRVVPPGGPVFCTVFLCYKEQLEASAGLKRGRGNNTWCRLRSSGISQVKSTVCRDAWQLGKKGCFLCSRYKKNQITHICFYHLRLKIQGKGVSWMKNMSYCIFCIFSMIKRLWYFEIDGQPFPKKTCSAS